jgi:heme/copper-type cytochrome/quinol oxidase subunit 3
MRGEIARRMWRFADAVWVLVLSVVFLSSEIA